MLSKLLLDMCQEYFSKELSEIWQVDSHLRTVARLYKCLHKSLNPIIANEVRQDYGEKAVNLLLAIFYHRPHKDYG